VPAAITPPQTLSPAPQRTDVHPAGLSSLNWPPATPTGSPHREPASAPPAAAAATAPSQIVGGGSATATSVAPPGATGLAVAVMALGAILLLCRLLTAPARWTPVLIVSAIERPG